jgi:hypothetical protein
MFGYEDVAGSLRGLKLSLLGFDMWTVSVTASAR